MEEARLGNRAGSQRPDLLGELIHHPGVLVALGGRDPLQPQALFVDAQKAQHPFEDGHPLGGDVVALDVMAIADVAAPHEDPVGAFLEGPDEEVGRDPGRAHHPDVASIGRILDTRRSGQIGSSIAAPVAKEGHNEGKLSLNLCGGPYLGHDLFI